jgi:hypothetical protein
MGRAALGVRATVAIIVVVAVVLRLGALQVGYVMDDHAQLAMLAGHYPVERAPWDLFAFCKGPDEVRALVDAGAFPWWTDPELRLATLRPLPSLTHWLDVRAFGHAPVPAHVHTLAWWIAMLVAAAHLLLRTLPVRWALVAFALFALDECHAQPVAWLANRNAAMSAGFGFVAIAAHVRWRDGGPSRLRVVAIVMLALALSCGESALGAVAYLAAWELGPGRGLPRRGARWPLLAIVVLWAVAHRTGGYGAFASGVYVDPVAEPVAWLSVAWQRLPIAFGDLLLALPTGRIAFVEHGPTLQAIAGMVAVIAAATWWWRRRETLASRGRAAFGWYGLGAALAVVPAASAFPSARLLVYAALGAAVWFAGWIAARPRSFALVWLVPHALLAPAWSWIEIDEVRRFGAAAERAAIAAPWPDGPVVLLRAPDPSTLLYPSLIRARAVDRAAPPWLVLVASGDEARFELGAPRTLDIWIDAGILETAVEQMFRRRDRMPTIGTPLPAAGGATATVLEARDGAPTHVRFELPTAPAVAWIATTHGLGRYPLPAPGKRLPLPGAAAAAAAAGSADGSSPDRTSLRHRPRPLFAGPFAGPHRRATPTDMTLPKDESGSHAAEPRAGQSARFRIKFDRMGRLVPEIEAIDEDDAEPREPASTTQGR